jgi:Haem-binding uptake, Tiki superfamily, ChaN
VICAAICATPWAALLGACAVHAPSAERIVDTATGRTLSCAALADVARDRAFVLLGEQHDEPTHHQRRGALIERLHGSGAAIVAEHLSRGAAVPALTRPVLPALTAMGFRPDAWGWPVHQPLFDGIAASGLPLRGGDLTAAERRSLMTPGAAALPAPLIALTAAAPLPAVARTALDADLAAAHGGSLPSARGEAMHRAQRARDASLLLALLDSHGQPALLVAGNGHVRADYGVPQLLRATQPAATVISVALVRPGEDPPGGAGAYTHVWTIDPAVPARACAQ